MAEGRAVRLVVVDDHSLFRRGVIDLLCSSGEYELVGEAESVSEIAELVHRTRPDVALIDIRLGQDSGLAVVPALRKTCPEVRIIIVTMYDAPAFRRSARAAGAHGFVTKRDADTGLPLAIRAVMAGRDYFGDDRGDRGGAYLPPGRSGGVPALADRELEVVRYIVRGHTNRSIAARLGISIKSVESYRARSMQKLGLSTRVDLVRYALEVGLIGGDEQLDE